MAEKKRKCDEDKDLVEDSIKRSRATRDDSYKPDLLVVDPYYLPPEYNIRQFVAAVPRCTVYRTVGDSLFIIDHLQAMHFLIPFDFVPGFAPGVPDTVPFEAFASTNGIILWTGQAWIEIQFVLTPNAPICALTGRACEHPLLSLIARGNQLPAQLDRHPDSSVTHMMSILSVASFSFESVVYTVWATNAGIYVAPSVVDALRPQPACGIPAGDLVQQISDDSALVIKYPLDAKISFSRFATIGKRPLVSCIDAAAVLGDLLLLATTSVMYVVPLAGLVKSFSLPPEDRLELSADAWGVWLCLSDWSDEDTRTNPWYIEPLPKNQDFWNNDDDAYVTMQTTRVDPESTGGDIEIDDLVQKFSETVRLLEQPILETQSSLPSTGTISKIICDVDGCSQDVVLLRYPAKPLHVNVYGSFPTTALEECTEMHTGARAIVTRLDQNLFECVTFGPSNEYVSNIYKLHSPGRILSVMLTPLHNDIIVVAEPRSDDSGPTESQAADARIIVHRGVLSDHVRVRPTAVEITEHKATSTE